ncbi:twin-arginine translocase TatA/TatE family subunit [Aggregicoccus sp. 17bor-14]|uniref:Sec-independent protein translocase subunit TatA/TatB n=1 Tax=Myxococcaceae TaxID=31 RepID=UPI00129CAD0C|nr:MULTISPECIES: twin-arginine translocase TatA/TatE family subunit [Myxococcaceae]MBF5044640.1 twin-arginine translocase TatA/TatE family subunit [Simulacricoccus sp. 17bor-14]MRI90384.1 twin-arginine translocase TatA/TatE family subunit [Aggregicoccus sp. 17bor-14]
MFNVGAGEVVFILVAALIILGPQRLPELARGLGKFMREFRRQTDEVRGTLEREFYRMDQELAREEPPAKAPAATPPAPAAFPLPALPPAPLEAAPALAAAAAAAAAPAPEPLESGPLLGMDRPPLDPSVARTQALEPLTPEAAAAALAAPASEKEPGAEPELPRLQPVPGTIARNALKRPPSGDEI